LDIRQNLLAVRERINRAAEKSGRKAEDIKLIAVTKTHSIEMIQQAISAGVTAIGENKVQEAAAKIPYLTGQTPEFHFIGHLQSNKISKLLSLHPILIHSIDSFELAEHLNSYLERNDGKQDILIEVNVTGEDSKTGIIPEETLTLVKEISQLPRLHVRGLMTIGLFDPNPEVTRPYFKVLKNLFDQIKSYNISGIDMNFLSMGMSDDFEIAIEEGSNMIRVGSAIFGPREYGKGA
jgi:PLP dependent protein